MANTQLDFASLAAGQLPNTKTTLYTVGALTQVAVKTLTVKNNGAGNNTVDIYFKVLGGITEVHIISVILATGDMLIMEDVGQFSAADFIEGKATNATECDYIISGGVAS